jgi:hypothetical protein
LSTELIYALNQTLNKALNELNIRKTNKYMKKNKKCCHVLIIKVNENLNKNKGIHDK